ncbi:hypothetical protein [Jatrophihabitans sp.]|uniref:hypothetical protein n=1 Tax=Jatrophihabitans sp. TaxID=1932789 RepID=UPI0030C6A1E6|nr:hypothetical protein [Jatrophihabitans sp.]
MAGAVVGVVGGSGGSGASTFAAALATCLGGPSVLVDVDPVGGGIDVLLGIEGSSGARWSELHLGGGRLDPAVLDAGLPRWGEVRVLAADTAPAPEAVPQVLEAAVELGPVVLDVPRAPGELRDAALRCCHLVAVVAYGSVAGIAAARRVIASLPDVPVGVVLRRGSVGPLDAAELLDVPVLASLAEPLRGRGVPAAWIRTGRAVFDGLLSGAV